MKKWKSEELQVKILCAGMILLLVAILVPLFWISAYNFKSVDDYSFSQNAEAVWRESHSVLKVLSAQAVETKEIYQTWQGTFFSQWFASGMMGIFGDSAYYVGTFLALGGFVLAELLLFMMIFVKGLGADKCRAAIVSIGCIALQVLLTPYPVEAFYWFCGAVVYTFIYALALFLLALLFLLSQAENWKKYKVILAELGIILLSVAVGGSNYVTGLTMLIFYFFYLVWMFWKKKKYKIMALCNMLVYLLAFGANILAPGNLLRQRSSGVERASAFVSILRSLKEAATYCIVNMNPPCVILGLLFLPIFVQIVKKKNFRYPLPLLVSMISFGVYAAQFTPTLYALQILGAGRVQNLYRFSFYVLLYANELYWTGWLWRRWREKHSEEAAIAESGEGGTSYLLPGWIVGGLLLCLSLVSWGGSTVTTVSAIRSLRSGEAKQYRQDYEERLVLLEDPSIKEIFLEPFSATPYLLFFGDVVEDTEDWVNQAVAAYFDKDVVGLKE